MTQDTYTGAPPDAGSRYAERRSVPRYAFMAAAEVVEPISKTRFPAQITEISVKGCFVKAPEPLTRNTVFKLRITYEGAEFETWARSAYAIPGNGMGAAFLQPNQDQMTILESWVSGVTAHPV
ncbi:MAG: PilZ domain-containing protein [Candidatus Acidiferrales bacterium]